MFGENQEFDTLPEYMMGESLEFDTIGDLSLDIKNTQSNVNAWLQ